jgi:hypothetical protein
MHKHPRARIRHKVKEFIKAGVDVDVSKVFCSRPDPLLLEELPCALIYFSAEPVTPEDTVPPKDKRTLRLVIEVLYKAGVSQDELDDWMDDRAYEVEDCLLTAPFEAWDYKEGENLIESIQLTDTIPYTVTVDGAKVAESTKLTFDITYYKSVVQSGSLDEFLRFIAEYKTHSPGAEAEDNVTIREV